MYNEYYKSWIPDVNVEKLKQNGFYKNILKNVSDEDIIYAWDSQVYTLGVQTYNKTGYLEYCSCEGCLVHSQYNYNLLTLATVLKLFLMQRGGGGSLSLTGQITFSETVALKTGMSKDWDGGYNSSQYGSPYYNLSTLTKELMVIVQKNVTRTRFSNIKSNRMSIQCKRPEEIMIDTQTLRKEQIQAITKLNLQLSIDPENPYKNELLEIKYQNGDTTKPYLAVKNNVIPNKVQGSQTIDVSPSATQENTDIASVKISAVEGNALSKKEDGLFVSPANNPRELINGDGTDVDNTQIGKVSVNLKTASTATIGGIKIDPRENNQLQVNPQTKEAYVPPAETPDLSNYYTKQETNSAISTALTPVIESITAMQEVINAQGQAITQLQQNLALEITRATNVELNLQTQINILSDIVFETQSSFWVGGTINDTISTIATIKSIPDPVELQICFKANSIVNVVNIILIKNQITDMNSIATMIETKVKTTSPEIPNFTCKWFSNVNKLIMTSNNGSSVYLIPITSESEPYPAQIALCLTTAKGAEILNPQS